jgi:hypothetical protein
MILYVLFEMLLYYLMFGVCLSFFGLIVVYSLNLKGFTYKDFISFTFFWLYAFVSLLNK